MNSLLLQVISYFSISLFFLIICSYFLWKSRKKHEEIFLISWKQVRKAIESDNFSDLYFYANELNWNPNMKREHYEIIQKSLMTKFAHMSRAKELLKKIDDIYEKKGWNAR